jgi:hypothetical protein
MTVAAESVTEETLAAVMENFSRPQEIVLDVQGPQIVYVFT